MSKLGWSSLLVVLALAACSGDYGSPTKPEPTQPTSDVDHDGFSVAEGDCNDEDDAFYPGANDVVGDDKDQNCDDVDGVDEDRDGQASMGSGGEDCDDADIDIYTGAPEIGWDDLDQNCDNIDMHDFLEVSAGKFHTCALDSTGQVRCFGGDLYGQVSLNQAASPGWRHVCSGFAYSCASHEDGTLICWGSDEDHVIQDVPDMAADQVSCGQQFACALDVDGYATCWGDDEFSEVTDTPSALQFAAIAAGGQFACGILRGDGRLVCWGDDRSDQVSHVPILEDDVNFVNIASGVDYSCAIRQDLGLRCWGHDADPWPAEPLNEAGPYSWISATNLTTCGIFEAKELECWGQNAPYNQVNDAPTNIDVHYVGIGSDHGCAIENAAGDLVCWGNDLDGQASPPEW